MNRIDTLFETKRHGVLSVYFCAGHPAPDGTVATLRALQEAGIDMVEIGIPFSDPLADGPVIQDAAASALRGGMTLRKLFGQLAGICREIHIPLLMMGYVNTVMHYGFEAFCRQCAEVGIDGLIIPDLPFEEYEREYKDMCERYGLKFVFLITPETSEERIRRIDAATSGFIYAVSSAAVTGARSSFGETHRAYFARLENMALRNPLLVGFGISNRATRTAADAHAAGVVVGSKFVSLLGENETPEQAVAALTAALDE